MCRIAGIISAASTVDEIQTTVHEMCRLQQHGGPDDEGYYSSSEPNIVLGHRRLSIIDLSEKAHQPMSYDEERFHVTYNGEIYNYKELKNELQTIGCDFKTNSDTEVILAAFSKWGISSFDKLDGMFAFALWDSRNSDLFLVRDRSGIKPLYYSTANNSLTFASEVSAFAPVTYLQKENPHWKVFLMAFGHLPEPVTTLQDVEPLQKGTYVCYNAITQKINVAFFARHVYEEKIIDRNAAIEKIKESLHDAVKRNLISDAPIGVFLSGGLDSSIIALLSDSDEKARLNTISIYFENEQFSEKKYQDIIQSKLSCNHHQHLVTEKDFHESLQFIIRSMDLPSCDGINTWFICKYAKENGLKAVLSGVGSDELFGGYPSFKRMKTTLALQKLPNWILRSGKYLGNTKYRRIQYLSIKGPVGAYLFLRGQFVPSEIAAYLKMPESEVWNILGQTVHTESISHLSARNQASWIETNLYMQNQLLRDSDVMSMAHGVEIRVPFLENDFVSLAMQINSEIKYEGNITKQLLVDSFKNILPAEIWDRPKMGFTFPFAEWFKNDEFAREHISEIHSSYYEQFLKGELHWSQFFTLLLLENRYNG